MKRIPTLAWLSGIALAATALSALAQDPGWDDVHAGRYLKYSEITTKIKAKLAAADELRSLVTVNVDTDSNGGVMLRGTAANRADANRAAKIAAATEGVTSVVDHIEVPSTLGPGAKD